MSEYIQNLNPTQRDAAVNYQGASLIIAGAGSGKTRVLTCRIAYMLSQGVQAHTVLALTFTNKAAKEMRERIATLVSGGMSRSLWMGHLPLGFSPASCAPNPTSWATRRRSRSTIRPTRKTS